jgi:hypothetical protein
MAVLLQKKSSVSLRQGLNFAAPGDVSACTSHPPLSGKLSTRFDPSTRGPKSLQKNQLTDQLSTAMS